MAARGHLDGNDAGARLSAEKQAMHGFGLAVDINVSGNPWIGAGWVKYDKELLKNCMVTADLRNESFYNQVMLICKAIGASYEIIDGQAVIHSRGCE